MRHVYAADKRIKHDRDGLYVRIIRKSTNPQKYFLVTRRRCVCHHKKFQPSQPASFLLCGGMCWWVKAGSSALLRSMRRSTYSGAAAGFLFYVGPNADTIRHPFRTFCAGYGAAVLCAVGCGVLHTKLPQRFQLAIPLVATGSAAVFQIRHLWRWCSTKPALSKEVIPPIG